MASDEDPPKGTKTKKKKDKIPPKIVVRDKKKEKKRMEVTAKMLEEQLTKDAPKKVKKKDKKERPFVGVSPDQLAGKKEARVKEPATQPPASEAKKEEGPAPLLCPDCGAELDEGAKKCPNCGIALAEGEEIVCAICGSPVDERVGVCLICGTRFMTKDEAGKVTDAPIEDFSGRSRRERREKRRPTVKVGKEPERPLQEKARPMPKKRKRHRAKVRRPPPQRPVSMPMVIAIIVVIAILLIAIFAVMYPGIKQFEVDGEFDEWDQVQLHTDVPQTDIGEHVNIIDYGVKVQDEDLLLYIRTKGTLFPGGETSPSYVNVFIDSDGDPDTGYLVNGIGAEHRIEVKGWSEAVRSAKYFSFNPSANANNWGSFTETGNIQAAASGSRLEISKPMSAFGLDHESSPAILFSVKDTVGEMDIAEAPIGLRPGGISVTQYIKAPSTPIAPGTGGQVFLSLKVEAKGESDTFRSVTLSRLGKGTPGDVSSITLWSGDVKVDDGKFEDLPRSGFQQVHLEPNLLVKPGTPMVLTVKFDMWEKVVSPTVGAMIFSTKDLAFKRSPVALHTVQEEALISYINRTPSQPTVDGAWGEWNSANSEEGGFLGGSPNPDIKFKEIRSRVVKDGHIKLSVEVTGQILAGSAIPDYEPLKETCGPSATCPNTGEAVIVIYMDSDSNSTTGRTVGSIGAELAVIIQGKYGIVDPSSVGFYDFDSGKGVWERISTTGVTAYTDLHRIEVELDLSSSGLQPPGDDHRYMLELRDELNDRSMSSVVQG